MQNKKSNMISYKKIVWLTILIILIIGFVIPQNFTMPVEGANSKSYNPNSFWFYPWGKSVTHKGVDIFAKEGTTLKSSTEGLVLYQGTISRGGKVVVILGPKWRVHYYAHLDKIKTSTFNWANSGETIGTVGTTGNAKGKPPHLHYSIITLFPYLWEMDSSKQGWKKMWYLNPIEYLQKVK
jgi:murein DD-endopeptidase MepM/ murein hydrolase activator NlpD